MSSVLGLACRPSVIVGASAVTAFARRDQPDDAVAFAVSAPLALAICDLLKRVVPERRPRLFDRHPEQSFPSSHSACTAALALTAAGSKAAWWAPALAAGVMFAVNAQRVLRREHWPHDVIVGDLIGIGCAVAGAAIARLVRRRRAKHRRASEKQRRVIAGS